LIFTEAVNDLRLRNTNCILYDVPDIHVTNHGQIAVITVLLNILQMQHPQEIMMLLYANLNHTVLNVCSWISTGQCHCIKMCNPIGRYVAPATFKMILPLVHDICISNKLMFWN